MSTRDLTAKLRQNVWHGSVPLEIRLDRSDCRTFDDSEPYLVQFPRLSYLGLLLHRLHRFFAANLIYPDVSPSEAWFSYEDVPLKWHYPLGLLYDLYSGAEPAYPSDTTERKSNTVVSEDESQTHMPWKLTIHYSSYPSNSLMKLDDQGNHLHDLFKNSVKEADYLRTGTGKTVMFLSKEDSTQLWESVKQHDFSLFNSINQKLLNPPGIALRHLPVKLYLPHAATEGAEKEKEREKDEENDKAKTKEKEMAPGSLRVVQALITPSLSSRQPQTIGTALNTVVPSLFPSRRSPLIAQAVLHGAVLPLGVSIEELVRAAAYMDGWLHIAVVMMG